MLRGRPLDSVGSRRLWNVGASNPGITSSGRCSGDCSIQPHARRPTAPDYHGDGSSAAIADERPDVHSAGGRFIAGRTRRGYAFTHAHRAAAHLHPTAATAIGRGRKVVAAASCPLVRADVDG